MAKTREIDTYLQADNFTVAGSVLLALDTDIQNYPLHLQDELNHYVDFKQKLIDLLSVGTPLDSLSSTDYDFIANIAENGVGQAQYEARELLCFFYGNCAEYPVITGSQSLMPMQTGTEIEKSEHEREFKIYPNPAGNWIAIELPKVDEPLTITVVDLTGRLIYQKQLGGINNTDRLSAVEIWDTELIGNGVYLITITNQTLTENYGTQRVVIQH